VNLGEPKKEEGKEEGEKKEGGEAKTEEKKDPCSEACCKDAEVVKVQGELEKMEANDPDFMDKVFELRDAFEACREKNAQEAQDKAAAEMEKAEDNPMLQPGFAVFSPSVKSKINTAIHSFCDGEPKEDKKKAEKGDEKGDEKKGDPCSTDCCNDPAVVKIKEEMAKMEGNDPKFMPKVNELKQAFDTCREKKGDKATAKAEEKLEETAFLTRSLPRFA